MVVGDVGVTVTGIGSVEDPYVVSGPPILDLLGVGRAVSTDGSFSLPTPTGSGLEFVITANTLEDIRYDGNDL